VTEPQEFLAAKDEMVLPVEGAYLELVERTDNLAGLEKKDLLEPLEILVETELMDSLDRKEMPVPLVSLVSEVSPVVPDREKRESLVDLDS